MRAGHNQYAPMPGVLALREALAAKIQRCYGATFDPLTEIQIVSGATAGLYATLTAFVHPGDEVVLFEPCYDSYVPVIRLSGGVPVFASLRYPDYRVDWDEVKRAITPRTRAILVNTPHNPTGIAWTADDMRQLAALVDGTDILLIGDEVYEHVIFDGREHQSLLRYPDLRSRACVISSFGKTYHTTGWKVGYCIAPKPILAEVQRVHQFMTFTVHTPSQVAFAEFVSRDPEASTLPALLPAEARPVPAAHRGVAIHAAGLRRDLLSVARLLSHLARPRHRHGDAAAEGEWRRLDSVLRVPLQGRRRPGAAILLREERQHAARGRRAAPRRLSSVVNSRSRPVGPQSTVRGPGVHGRRETVDRRP